MEEGHYAKDSCASNLHLVSQAGKTKNTRPCRRDCFLRNLRAPAPWWIFVFWLLICLNENYLYISARLACFCDYCLHRWKQRYWGNFHVISWCICRLRPDCAPGWVLRGMVCPTRWQFWSLTRRFRIFCYWCTLRKCVRRESAREMRVRGWGWLNTFCYRQEKEILLSMSRSNHTHAIYTRGDETVRRLLSVGEDEGRISHGGQDAKYTFLCMHFL